MDKVSQLSIRREPNVIFTSRNEVLAKVIFLHLSVILFTGGEGSGKENPPPPWAWRTPPAMENPPRPAPPDQTPPDQTPPSMETPCPPTRHLPPAWRTPPTRHPPGMETPPGSRLWHTVYDRPVRILLECILVCNITTVAGRL